MVARWWEEATDGGPMGWLRWKGLVSRPIRKTVGERGRRRRTVVVRGGQRATGDWQQAAAHGDGGGAWVERDREMLKPMLLLVDYLSHYI